MRRVEVRNVSLLVAISVSADGYRQILGIVEGGKEDKAGWSAFLNHLKGRGLRGVELIVSDACMGLVESAAEFIPEARWQWCMVGSLKKLEKTGSVFPDDSRMERRDMLGRKERDQLELFITGSLRQLIPDDHVLARVDRVLDLS